MTDERDERVVLGLIDGGTWSSAFGLSLLDLQLFDACGPRRIVQPGCGYLRVRASTMGVASARNDVARRFLDDTKGDWLIFIDTDMGFEPSLVEQLLDAACPDERPIVGALTFSQRFDQALEAPLHAQRYLIQPVIYQWLELEDNPETGQRAEKGFLRIMEYPREQVIQVSGTGAACILIHRSALETVRKKNGDRWFSLLTHPTAEIGGGPRGFSEDLSFCVRAQAVGIPIHVDTRVKATHDKGGIFLDEATFRAQECLSAINRVGGGHAPS